MRYEVINAQNSEFRTLFISQVFEHNFSASINFTILVWLFSTFWNNQIFIFIYKIDPPLKFNLNVIGKLNFKNWAIFGFFEYLCLIYAIIFFIIIHKSLKLQFLYYSTFFHNKALIFTIPYSWTVYNLVLLCISSLCFTAILKPVHTGLVYIKTFIHP